MISPLPRTEQKLKLSVRSKMKKIYVSCESLEVQYGTRLFKSLFPNTELGIDLKLLTREPGRMQIGEHLNGMLTRDDEDHFLFVQDANMKNKKSKVHRNPIVIFGNFVNIHITEDGIAYPTFNRPRYTPDFTFCDFCLAAAKELIEFSSLLEENGAGVGEE